MLKILFLFLFLLTFFIFPNFYLVQAQTDKLGQILMINIYPYISTSILLKLINYYQVGNFNLVGQWPAEKAQKIINFIKMRSKIQPFIAVDEEGYISRLPHLNSLPQSLLENERQVYFETKRRSRELKKLGFNMIFSPVLDFTTNSSEYIYKRTFAKDKEKTIKFGIIMIKAYQKEKILSIPKHFPCYKGINTDPHGSALSISSLSDFSDCLDVFRAVFDEARPVGLMVGHNLIKEFGDKPLTRSMDFVNFIKKDYSGLLITDSIGMKSFFLDESLPQAAEESILAGYDLIILPSNLRASFKILDFLKQKYQNDKKFSETVDKQYLKILLFKLINYGEQGID